MMIRTGGANPGNGGNDFCCGRWGVSSGSEGLKMSTLPRGGPFACIYVLCMSLVGTFGML